MPGGGAKKRKNIKLAQEKQAAKKAAKKQEQFVASLPKITEDDLLNFQIKHFGDDTRPAEWFISKERALNFADEQVEYENDLGYYPDGVKRTLTDEQIAIFRRRELYEMQRDQQRAREEAAEERAQDGDEPRSPASDVSELEDDLLTYAAANFKRPSPTPPPAAENATMSLSTPNPATANGDRRPSQQTRSDMAESSASWKQRRSQQEVPYSERHKRKWESYVTRVDDVEGSMTHRRLARELDNQQDEKVEMDY
ncbi:Hypothetical predicted protein [Lecanosticta acicola]|uniref:Uncharacterized protein n=1 Tax=Lecanosticta acicola TaxID=111012 RepID=A0AAI9ECA9_9PEZI|nr:Hypothetical predicted protein [Lecanosticta acicola]